MDAGGTSREMRGFIYIICVLLLLYCDVVSSNTLLVAVSLAQDSTMSPQSLAIKYGYTYVGPVGNLEGVHLFSVSPDRPVRDPSSSSLHQLQASLATSPEVLSVYDPVPLMRRVRYTPPTDPQWKNQWPLHNVGQLGEKFRNRDINVEPAWVQGFTGEGVVIGVVDNGIIYTHEDIKDNFISRLSADFVDMDDDVSPSIDPATGRPDHHGTRCAGVMAMARSNGVCGVGVAYKSGVAGIRLLSPSYQSDAMEASALGVNNQEIDIYSNSWGPQDDGVEVEGPGPLVSAVLEQAVRKGRNGRGSIYVWAAGNGGHVGDHCSTDGYVSSIQTIAVGSADQTGQPAFYDEECPAKMVVATHYNRVESQGGKDTQAISSGGEGQCMDDFIGTSVACPLVSGLIALALQANPSLTWRDVQYLLAYTSRHRGLGSFSDWRVNGGGLPVNRYLGFGAVDGEALVSRARHWTSVPPQHSYSIKHSLQGQRWQVTIGNSLLFEFDVDEKSSRLTFLEHVVLRVSVELGGTSRLYSYIDYITIESGGNQTLLKQLTQHRDVRRGDVTITLQSPFGTVSHLLPHRPQDFINNIGFEQWPLMSVHHWAESPQGRWIVNISHVSHRDSPAHTNGYALVTGLELELFGTLQRPQAVDNIPKRCSEFCEDRGKCGGVGANMCDRCQFLRHASTLKCVDSCLSSEQEYEGYCIPSKHSTPPNNFNSEISSVVPDGGTMFLSQGLSAVMILAYLSVFIIYCH